MFAAYVNDKCQALLEEIDNWLTNLEKPDVKKGDVVIQTGVGIYHFVIKEDLSEVPIEELLESRTATE